MSENEIIKNLNDLLEHNYLEDVGYLREENDYVVYNNAIQGLLDLYQKEKEKNKELTDNYDKLTQHFIKNHISKDKIKEKIKEINNRRIEDGQCELALHGFQREAKIDVLKELLEEN